MRPTTVLLSALLLASPAFSFPVPASRKQTSCYALAYKTLTYQTTVSSIVPSIGARGCWGKVACFAKEKASSGSHLVFDVVPQSTGDGRGGGRRPASPPPPVAPSPEFLPYKHSNASEFGNFTSAFGVSGSGGIKWHRRI